MALVPISRIEEALAGATPTLAFIINAGVIEIPDDILGVATVTFNTNAASAQFQIDGGSMYQGPAGSSRTMEVPAGTVLTCAASSSIFAVYYI